ncbi:hypothetical protein [Pseudomonas avellanae]|uniref:hypothetical protein n=3 Tax=Pseudomonas avellanae TaxID=46257 RepID=UPI001E4588FC|nr:hypothetical protein [Pseudomonas avellanae]UQW68679.1 hypothetical protein L2Y00_26505 [Pseudomonas avellanae]
MSLAFSNELAAGVVKIAISHYSSMLDLPQYFQGEISMAVPNVSGLGMPVTDDFEAWLGERNRWLQTAAKNLIETKKPPTDDQITELARLCIVESKKEQDPGFGTVTPSVLFSK